MHGTHADVGRVSIETLRQDISATKSKLHALQVERGELALQSVLGDAKAVERIADIDIEQHMLNGRLQTCHDAIRTLQTQQQQTSWRVHLPGLLRAFRVELHEGYDFWPHRLNQLMIGRQSHDIAMLREAVKGFDLIEQDTARMIADRILPEARVPFHTAGDQADLNRARAEHAKLIEQRNRHINEVVEEMLASTNLKRPRALEDALARARQRIEVGKR